MKLRNILSLKSMKFAHQKGQAIVEFVMILAVMATITFAFVGFMNRNLARYWEHAANLVINDRPGVKTVTLD
jgi:hypothetical protein